MTKIKDFLVAAVPFAKRATLWGPVIVGTAAILLMITVLVSKPLACRFGGDMAAWVQAVGAILAIVTGFALSLLQVLDQRAQLDRERLDQRAQLDRERRDIAHAAYLLASDALLTVKDRIEFALTPSGPAKVHFLQGNRTTEMIRAMREFDLSLLPNELLTPFIRLRSHVFSVNQRIKEVYDDEVKGDYAEIDRANNLKSAIKVLTEALEMHRDFGATCKVDANMEQKINLGPHTKAADIP